jgi:hypothetical protein
MKIEVKTELLTNYEVEILDELGFFWLDDIMVNGELLSYYQTVVTSYNFNTEGMIRKLNSYGIQAKLTYWLPDGD